MTFSIVSIKYICHENNVCMRSSWWSAWFAKSRRRPAARSGWTGSFWVSRIWWTHSSPRTWPGDTWWHVHVWELHEIVSWYMYYIHHIYESLHAYLSKYNIIYILYIYTLYYNSVTYSIVYIGFKIAKYHNLF